MPKRVQGGRGLAELNLSLQAIYHFTNDDLILGTRMIMLAVRTAVEEGLYHRDTLVSEISDIEERQVVTRQLWSLFALDRQFNFAAGLPCLLDPSDIDLPNPVSRIPICDSPATE
jgi:hypothetical protein